MQIQIMRLEPDHAQEIVDCFRRVYGDSYANETFYDAEVLGSALSTGRIGSVGAVAADGRVLGHMAMTVHAGAPVVELGNTVVDPAARGEGLAWKVGAELSSWCRELGYQGFLHYPTTDHHIMQRQSVKAGFETGLMLGYIPAETHGRVGVAADRGRQAATIVYEPYTAGAHFEGYLPEAYAELLGRQAANVGLPRTWRVAEGNRPLTGVVEIQRFPKRGLERFVISPAGSGIDGSDLEAELATFLDTDSPCLQIDFSLAESAVDDAVRLAQAAGFGFCGWLPGYRGTDVLRLQRVDPAVTDLSPALENPEAVALLQLIRAEADTA